MPEGCGQTFGFDHHIRIDRHKLVELQSASIYLREDRARHGNLERARHREWLVGVDEDARTAPIKAPGGDADDAIGLLRNPRDFDLERCDACGLCGRREQQRSRCKRD
jgi:hypothetical protein